MTNVKKMTFAARAGHKAGRWVKPLVCLETAIVQCLVEARIELRRMFQRVNCNGTLADDDICPVRCKTAGDTCTYTPTSAGYQRNFPR